MESLSVSHWSPRLLVAMETQPHLCVSIFTRLSQSNYPVWDRSWIGQVCKRCSEISCSVLLVSCVQLVPVCCLSLHTDLLLQSLCLLSLSVIVSTCLRRRTNNTAQDFKWGWNAFPLQLWIFTVLDLNLSCFFANYSSWEGSDFLPPVAAYLLVGVIDLVGRGGLGWGCRSQSPAGRGTVVACCRWYGPSPSSPSPWRRCRRVERAPVMMEEGWVKRWTGLSPSNPMETGLGEAWVRYDFYRREPWSLL